MTNKALKAETKKGRDGGRNRDEDRVRTGMGMRRGKGSGVGFSTLDAHAASFRTNWREPPKIEGVALDSNGSCV